MHCIVTSLFLNVAVVVIVKLVLTIFHSSFNVLFFLRYPWHKYFAVFMITVGISTSTIASAQQLVCVTSCDVHVIYLHVCIV